MEVLRWAEPVFANPEAEKNLLDSFDVVKGFLARRLLGGVPPQQLRSSVADMAKRLNAELRTTSPSDGLQFLPENLRDRFQDLGSEKYPDNDALRASAEVPVYNLAGKKQQLFLIMWELECHLSPEHATMTRPPYGTGANRWSIEHVLPQGVPQPRTTIMGPQPIRVELAENWRAYWEEHRRRRAGHRTSCPKTCPRQFDADARSRQLVPWHARLRHEEAILSRPKCLGPFPKHRGSRSSTPDAIRSRSRQLLEAAIERWPW